jgi:hypothetical protein
MWEQIYISILIARFAGGDLLENIYKIILKKPSLYEAPVIVQK